MGNIVCATRIGELSRIIQRKAIDLAKSQNDRLVFVYVVNLDNLGEIDDNLVDAVRMELTWFGEALLAIAKQRGRRSGVDTQVEIRDGEVREQIEAVLREYNADLLILGKPREDLPTQTFTQSALQEFAQIIQTDTGVEVKIV